MHICMLLLAKYREGNQPVTGVDLQAITQIHALKDAGHDITVIAKKRSLDSQIHEVLDGVNVYRIGPSGLYWLWTAIILLKKRRQFNAVYLLGQRFATLEAILLCRLLDIPTILKFPISLKQFTWRQFHEILILKLKNFISRQASAYHVISTDIANQLIAAGFYQERIKRVPNGVDMDRFSVTSDKNALRIKLKLPLDKKIVVYSGRLIPRKGFDIALDAWSKIYAAYPDVHFVVVGGGPKESVASLEQLADKVGRDTITYVGPVSDVAPYLAASDIYLFPSRREGLPNALLEAMSCGCACVASDIGGCVDLIIPEKTGLLFPSGDAQAMAEAAIQLLHDESLIQTVSQNAHSLIAAEYELRSVIERLINLYCTLSTKS